MSDEMLGKCMNYAREFGCSLMLAFMSLYCLDLDISDNEYERIMEEIRVIQAMQE